MNKLIAAVGLAIAAAAVAAQVAPYAGQHDRQIKSLSEKDVADLLAGQGMGLAKAAELNGFPGPAHVLENAAALGLSDGQRGASEALLNRHKTLARALGAQLLAAERELDLAFAGKGIEPVSLARLTREIGIKQAQLREEHLRTHLEQSALLTPAQIGRYAELRGYTAAPGAVPPAQHHPQHH